MIHEEKKIAKIIEELTMYFFAMGSDNIHSGIERHGNQVKIFFDSNYDPINQERVHSLEKYLNEPKNEGMEDVYWELAGSGDPGESSQLLLVGMMIDKADINIGEDKVSLVLYKEII
ncbi:MAG: hypothetical protein E7291_09290 [Lachnospiraceae bacterium]|nr:hypothetical protein [Lachnospiraceae bacterium]